MEESKRIERRQCKYLNNIVEQDHRLIKHITKPMLGFKNFYCAQKTLAGIELIKMLKKSQMRCPVNTSKTPVELFYELAGYYFEISSQFSACRKTRKKLFVLSRFLAIHRTVDLLLLVGRNTPSIQWSQN
jgi:hypothetical protein